MGEHITKYRANVASRTEVFSSNRFAKSIDIPSERYAIWLDLKDVKAKGEVRLDVARQFAESDESFKPFVDEFDSIVKEHGKIGHITGDLSDRRAAATSKMLRKIRDEYGDKTYRYIYSVM